MKYTKEIGKKLLECLPEEYVAIACDADGSCYAFKCTPQIKKTDYISGLFLIKYDVSKDWEDSLVVREKWVPKHCEKVYITLVANEGYCVCMNYMESVNKCALERNLIFRTKEEAIKRAKELLSIK